MIKLYEEQKNTIYSLQKKTGLSKYALYKYASKIANLDNMRFSTLEKIAEVEGVNPYELLKKMKEYQAKKA